MFIQVLLYFFKEYIIRFCQVCIWYIFYTMYNFVLKWLSNIFLYTFNKKKIRTSILTYVPFHHLSSKYWSWYNIGLDVWKADPRDKRLRSLISIWVIVSSCIYTLETYLGIRCTTCSNLSSCQVADTYEAENASTKGEKKAITKQEIINKTFLLPKPL